MNRISLDNVTKVFNQGRPNEYAAIRGVSLTIEPNKVTCLKGPSGSGKSTLLSMIGCLSRPSSGRIHLGDQMISGLPERFLTDIRRHTFGFIFQQFNLIAGLSVIENVILPAYPLAPDHQSLMMRAHELLARFELDHKADSQVQWLSGGEAQRAAICRALINNPQILIADEPTANLDTKLSHAFMGQMSQLRKLGKTVLITSHDPVVFDSPVVDSVVELLDGSVFLGEEHAA
ncbi:ABC transporter ATP-binding protein [Sedimenticola selenatireducens]|uniref:ABC transporter ATP-binding protein n=1 Tax=Sedimenticola selenatireducens TaxID=191960 RepID=A0A558DLS7_9GAMM|nr:ABC transporter ATP-binding protein [Sedimenticola selenatireducens]TVO69540.1 ABC transporter ATP-binding protein [Sedimenticola selenatireducens]TVT61933.1 MAG: ABC transporter ATP-binding protein [Sedimenticola selenatireducens]